MTGSLKTPGSGLKQPTNLSRMPVPANGGIPIGSKRKMTSDDLASTLHPPSHIGSGIGGQAGTRPIKAIPSRRPIPRAENDKAKARRRRSSGFKETLNIRNSTTSALKTHKPAGGGIANLHRGGIPIRNGMGRGGGRKAAAAPTRVPASRTAITRGRLIGGNSPPSDSVKRRRIDLTHGLNTPPNLLKNDMGMMVTPTQGNRNDAYHGLDDDDSDDDDKLLGPPPPIHNRPEHDYDGRLKDLEATTKYLSIKVQTVKKKKRDVTVELEQNTQKVIDLELESKTLSKSLDEYKTTAATLQSKLDDSERNLVDQKHKYEDSIDDMQRDFKREKEKFLDSQHSLEKSISELRDSLEEAKGNLKLKKEECLRLEGTISKQSSEQIELESSYRTLKSKLDRLETILSERDAHIVELEGSVSLRNHTIEELEAKLRKEETMRRQLHNTIQELKGNIRVFCRVRPLSETEKDDSSGKPPISFPECDDNNEIELSQTSENAMGKATSKSFPFKFDRVFTPDTSQDIVFDEVSQLIQSALDGYPVCIFAYGQTGSGKTHTMQGPDDINVENAEDSILGIIPRAVKQIYDTTNKLTERGWEYKLEGQFLEIYNESLQDLLTPSNSNKTSDKQQQPPKLEIYQDNEGHTRVKNITTVKVDSAKRVHWLLARAAENRTVASTNCNERSSRSHSVFTLYLHGTNSLTGESSTGILNLIDLAGSERLSISGSRGERLKETQAINKSLASLGDVIAALAKGSKHIPYRNSKLTHLLQESLGAGNSKTLMFVCINPSPQSTQESLCSLQFATKVNSCQIGTARRQAA